MLSDYWGPPLFSKKIKAEISRYSNGLAAIAHQLALNICFESNIYQTKTDTFSVTPDKLKNAVKRYVEEESDTIKEIFDRALKRKKGGKYDNCRLILSVMAHSSELDGLTRSEIMQAVRKKEAKYPESNLTRYLNELTSVEKGGLIAYSENSGRYTFNNPFHKAFALALLDKDKHLYSVRTTLTDEFLITIFESLSKKAS